MIVPKGNPNSNVSKAYWRHQYINNKLELQKKHSEHTYRGNSSKMCAKCFLAEDQSQQLGQPNQIGPREIWLQWYE